MDFIEFIVAAIAFVVGFALGCVFYRRQLKRDPKRLDELAATIKNAGKRFE